MRPHPNRCPVSVRAMLQRAKRRLAEPRRFWGDTFAAAVAAGVLGGIPSTMLALATGGDVLAPTLAAGAMLVDAQQPTRTLVLAAALVHALVSSFWSAVLTALVPANRVVSCAMLAATAIGVLDLKIIAPLFFPEVAALPFLPQIADHLAWGAAVGFVLRLRWRGRDRP